jgi:hypothetical protein
MRVAAVLVLMLGCRASCDVDVTQRGERLFRGEESLAAEVQGQGVPLPAEASRCVNCHSGPAAPALDRASLLGRVSRRNGPPSRYDEASFCALLRSGVDPALVVVLRVMPRYEVDEAQCHALFAFVTSR